MGAAERRSALQRERGACSGGSLHGGAPLRAPKRRMQRTKLPRHREPKEGPSAWRTEATVREPAREPPAAPLPSTGAKYH
jgi:hypothetical protein